jgi:hypothetical protein
VIILGIGTFPLRRVSFHNISGTGFEDDAAADFTNLTLVDTDLLVSSSGLLTLNLPFWHMLVQ